jgi:feruloyl esterase
MGMPDRFVLYVAASTLLLTAAAGLMPAQAAKPMSCESLTALNLPNTVIKSAVTVPAGPFSSVPGTGTLTPTCSSNITAPFLPAFCRVTAATQESSAPEPITFEVWLPLQNWNGKFEAVGNHGFAGEFEYSDMGPELVKGYAVASTDTGHAGSSATAWMQNAQQVINYGYLGVHDMTVNSKSVIRAFYGSQPHYSYFNGCSTGGKEGLMEAQRYPADYDGINIGGSANFAQIHNRIEYVWNGQKTFGNAGTPLNAATLAIVNAAAVAACDANDGVIDGVIGDPLTCNFDPGTLVCQQGQDPSTCLTAAQVAAVEAVYQGPRNPKTGKEIYPGLEVGTERGWGSGTTGPGVSTADTFFKYMVYNNPSWDFRTFNFGKDTKSTDDRFSNLIDAIDPDLTAFKNRGGKILQSHLWSSVVHPATRSIEYYEQVVMEMSGGKPGLSNADFDEPQDFYRLFMAPGGSGSKGPGTFDSMPYLEKWVEQGIAPKTITASHFTSGVVDRTRPLCPYPSFAVYQGTGSTDDAANFKCKKPQHVINYFKVDGPEMDD